MTDVVNTLVSNLGGDLANYVPGTGNPNAKLMIIGSAPAANEVVSLKPFTGPNGIELDKLLKDCGISRNEVWLTNFSKFFVPPAPKYGKKPSFKERMEKIGLNFERAREELYNEINSINPNCIMPLGGDALTAVMGVKKNLQDTNYKKFKIHDYRGSILFAMGKKCVPTYQPAHLLHMEGEIKGYWNRPIIEFDIKRAFTESKYREIELPSRNLQICHSAEQLRDFQKRYSGYKYPSIDIEAHPNGSCIPICIGIAYTPHEGICVPLWNFDGISDITDSELVEIWMVLSQVLYQEVIGQNFMGYDNDKIRRIGFIIKSLKSDTMMKAFAINPELPKNLAFLTSIYTREPFYKNEGMYQGKLSDLLIGCARDACVTKEIDLAMDPDLDSINMRPYYENFLMKLPPAYEEIVNEGFLVDRELRFELLKKYVEWDERLKYELWQMCGSEVNTSSPKQVANLIYGTWKLPQRKGVGEEVLTQLLNNNVKNLIHRKGIENILESRRVKKTISDSILAIPDFDGRMRTSYFLCLETGRTSTNQQEIPIRPAIEYRNEKNEKKVKALGKAFQTMTKHGDIGPEVRAQYKCDEGEIFIQADSSQAEARVVARLCNDLDMLKMYDEHDIHALTASWFFGGDEAKFSKKVLGYECPERFAGKTLRHAGHLGAGKRRAAIEVNTQARKYHVDLNISEGDADKALKTFHARAPKVKSIFHNGVIKALENNKRRLIAPKPYGVDAPHGGVRIFFERWDEELFRQAFAYLPQRAVSDNTKNAIIRIKARAPWIRILLEAHDSILCSVKIERLNEASGILKQEMEREIDFSHCSLQRDNLIIPCELETGFNYRDLSKFKYFGDSDNFIEKVS